VPFLLAIVLGGFAENYLNLSTAIFDMEWVTRPGVLILGVVILASVTYGIRTTRRRSRLIVPESSPDPVKESERS
jgi:hypothetical protein